MRPAISFAVLALLIPLGWGQSPETQSYPGSIILDIYVGDSGHALLIGQASHPDLVGNLPDNFYDKDTGQIIGKTDSLTSKRGADWRLEFMVPGTLESMDASFYLPMDASIVNLELSGDLSYAVGVEEGRLVVSVAGFMVVDPAVIIDYKRNPAMRKDGRNLLYPFVIAAIAAFLVSKRGWIRAAPEAESSGPENPIVNASLQRVMGVLSERERAIVKVLLDNGGTATQAKIRWETGIPKSSLTGIVNGLRRRNIIEKRRYGRTNKIELSDDFLSENTDDSAQIP